MAIRFSKYVDITSGVGGAALVAERELILRLFTTNPLVPTESFLEFDTAEDVLAYFGAASEEYARAAFYFGWVSKNTTSPKKLSIARWVNVSVAPRIYGVAGAKSLAAFQAISNGSLEITLGAEVETITGVDFTTAVSLTNVAAILQTAIIAAGVGAQWDASTVTYDAVNQRFNFVGGDPVVAVVAVDVAGVGTDIAGLLGWLTGAILSDGALLETPTESIIKSSDASNNFGSFRFMPALTDADVEALATWNHGQNVMFMFLVAAVDLTEASDLFAALAALSGVAVTLQATAGEYAELIPGIILAATDYNRRNAVQNYMFQQFDVEPAVADNTLSNALDAVRGNYYGQTQTAGQKISFYQRGVLMGGATAPVDMNTYANEMWLKDASAAALLGLLLALGRVSANTTGRAQVISTLQATIDRALLNGTISVGKPLNNTQKLFIADVTGDPKAWHQVQGVGYWLDCHMESYVTIDLRTEWKAVFTLVYSKDDAIRKIEGVHTLI